MGWRQAITLVHTQGHSSGITVSTSTDHTEEGNEDGLTAWRPGPESSLEPARGTQNAGGRLGTQQGAGCSGMPGRWGQSDSEKS